MTSFFVTLGILSTACDSGPTAALSPPQVDESMLDPEAAEALVIERSCLACHEGEGALAQRLAPAPAPPIDATIRARWAPAALERFLSDPSARHEHAVMPDVLAALDDEARADVTHDLMHFLLAPGKSRPPSTTVVQREEIELGRALFGSTGCRACHGDDLAAALASSTAVEPLTKYLLDPLARHPSGRMPLFRLSPKEARSLAAYLLRDQAATKAGFERRGGLRLEYLESTFESEDAELTTDVVPQTSIAPRIDLSLARREEHFGLRFAGLLTIDEPGDYVFSTTSDDGSWLWIDGQLVVENGGHHPPEMKSGKIQLAAGDHAIRVHMYEHEGGQELTVTWQPPGRAAEPIPEDRLSHEQATLHLAMDEDVPSSWNADSGEWYFISLGCANCHQPSLPENPPEPPPVFATLRPGRGCLAPDAASRGSAPRHALKNDQRLALDRLIVEQKRFHEPRSAATEVEVAMRRLRCTACHERDGIGGPTDDVRAAFSGTADLGDQARVPPRLNGVGRKLTQPWLHQVLVDGRSVRRYMNARMPSFGTANVGTLAAAFAAADAQAGDDAQPPTSPEILEAGRHLIGRKGFSCANCHLLFGHGDPRQHAIDLATVAERLRPVWHAELLLDPDRVNPGTRMVRHWSDEKIWFPDVLDGDARRQVDAVYAYLASHTASLPHGTVFDDADYDLTPRDEVIVFGTFMRGVSPRTLCVGFPDGLHYAFDVERARLARVWRGDFMNAAGTWHDRAGKLSSPQSLDVIDLPAGDVIARLADDAPKPAVEGRGSGAVAEIRRDADRAPIWVIAAGDAIYEERARPFVDASGKLGLRRTITTVATTYAAALRAARSSVIEEVAPSVFRSAEGVTIRVVRGQPQRRATPAGFDLLLPLQAEQIVELELTW